MKVYIGEYKNSFGTWQLTKILFGWVIKNEETLDKIHEFFDSLPWLVKTLEYIDNLRGIEASGSQDVFVKIDHWDTWSLDVTLAHVISPALHSFRDGMVGYKVLDKEDLPDEFKDETIDGNLEKGWQWALDEMIFSFDFIKSDKRWDLGNPEHDETWDRVNNGLRLFGKYYNALWT